MLGIPTSRRYKACPECNGRGVFGRVLMIAVFPPEQWVPRECRKCHGRGYVLAVKP